MNRTQVKIAAAQYPITRVRYWRDYVQHCQQWTEQAAQQGCRLLVFPEYAAMELGSLLPSHQSGLQQQLMALQGLLPDYLDLWNRLSRECSVSILSGSFSVRLDSDTFVNRAYFFSPNRPVQYQDKRQMTRFEKETWESPPVMRSKYWTVTSALWPSTSVTIANFR